MRGHPRGWPQPFSGPELKTNVYVDGFNLYFGCLKGTPYKWLDLARLCGLLLPGDTINRIRYFTARIEPRAGDPDKQQRQQAYVRALGTLPNLSVHYGHFLTKGDSLPLVSPPPRGPRVVEVWRTEEKGSDVNLATYMLTDGFEGEYELAVVISNDSDLRLPIQVVRRRLGLAVGVLNPIKQSPSQALRQVASFQRPIRNGPLGASQFPPSVTDANGTFRKPIGW